MAQQQRSSTFDPSVFLAGTGVGRTWVHIEPKHAIYFQDDLADAIFYLQSGRAKLTVSSVSGKEGTVSLLVPGDFVGEESLAAGRGFHSATASAVTACKLLRIERAEMNRRLHEEQAFSDMFLRYLLTRVARSQADVVDLLFNSSEKRLARVLLMMADSENMNEAGGLIPKITQEALADIVGTTRSRVSFFMNRFRTMGFITYKRRIWVNASLTKVLRLAEIAPAGDPETSPVRASA